VRFPQGEGPMSIEAAERVIASVEAGFPPPPDDPARHPRTLEDIQAILARDQVTLFPGAVDRLARLPGVEARALEAQIELAWGESYSLVMTILLEVATYLEG